MTTRIDWAGTKDAMQDSDNDSDDEAAANQNQTQTGKNYCDLVWQGTVVKRAFANFRFQECRTAATARKVMEAKGVAHYWDMILKPEMNTGAGSAAMALGY
jgi:U4/U6 small nuclear ribonucleoprotein PRP3